MLGSSIAFVTGEAVAGVAAVKVIEETVSLDLGQDGGCCYGAGDGVAVDEIELRNGGLDFDGVDEEMVWLGVEGLDGAEHGEAAGLEDVEGTDFFDARKADGPGDGLGLKAGGEPGTFCGGHDFRVAEAADFAGVRKNDSSSSDWPKQTTPAGFIDAGRS
jgi:hypothetical protein